MKNNLNDLDLNINNYSLDDILNLFKLSHDFNEYDIKKTKKVVLMTHPDKSGLDKKFFLSFSLSLIIFILIILNFLILNNINLVY